MKTAMILPIFLFLFGQGFACFRTESVGTTTVPSDSQPSDTQKPDIQSSTAGSTSTTGEPVASSTSTCTPGVTFSSTMPIEMTSTTFTSTQNPALQCLIDNISVPINGQFEHQPQFGIPRILNGQLTLSVTCKPQNQKTLTSIVINKLLPRLKW